ncbi:MAG: (Fe-S)-binding protein [Deltaproteobacteria bacterium]|nr:(Fe-S)-binding protein [Deltaproteobacteria bacterium]
MSYETLKPFLFGLLFLVAQAGFAWSVWRMVRLARLGQDKKGLFENAGERIKDLVAYVFLQKRVRDRPFGYNHVIIFWSFVIISIGHVDFMVHGIIPAFSMLWFGSLGGLILAAADVMAFVVLFAIAAALFRRIVIKPWFIYYKSADAFVVLGLITMVMLTYFGATAAGIRGGHPDVAVDAHWYPVSSFFASTVYASVSTDSAQGPIYEALWWSHAFVLLFFLNYIPHSKHQHLVGAIPNVFLNKKDKPKAALARLDFENENAESFGVGKFTDFTWKALFDTYACTECGRCDLGCPAANTKKPLQPQKVIHDIKNNMKANGLPILASRKLLELTTAPKEWEVKLPLIVESEQGAQKGQISADVLWSCTTCGACVDACPVLIDHVDAIMDMRRYVTLTEGNVPAELANTFKNIENNYNPWGIGADKRADWAEGLGLKLWETSADASKYEYLFWVGCAGSYDNRAQKTVKAFTRILDAAKIGYAILGTNEKCSGDPLRRTGNEYAFDALAQENVAMLNEMGIKKVVTACPHCFNTLKNEYPAFGGKYEVVHHSQLIGKLLDEGKIKLDQEMMKKVTFHDPCYLGRWNQEFEAPRRSLAAVRSLQMVEMENSKRTSMCCGAGGGQMWKEEKLGTRVNLKRTEEALATGADTIAVACPFCMTMIEDGVKSANKEESVKVLDVAEVIAQAMTKPT